jgi:hypothetical protein
VAAASLRLSLYAGVRCLVEHLRRCDLDGWLDLLADVAISVADESDAMKRWGGWSAESPTTGSREAAGRIGIVRLKE